MCDFSTIKNIDLFGVITKVVKLKNAFPLSG
jgi:hypothetical protein